MASKAAKANASLDLEGKTAAVSGQSSLPLPRTTTSLTLDSKGGTSGIGAGVALRFAQLGCSRVLIVGRNEQRGNQVIEKLKASAKSRSFDAEFIKADLSSVCPSPMRLARRADDAQGPVRAYVTWRTGWPRSRAPGGSTT